MDLSFLIPSRVRRKVLAYFVEDPEAQVYVRELARELEEYPQQVYRELINLENFGMLFSSSHGNLRVFRLNKKFPLLEPLSDLFRRFNIEQNRTLEVVKTYNLEEEIERLKKIPTPKEMIPGLTAKRKRPRAYAEEKLLRKKNMLPQYKKKFK